MNNISYKDFKLALSRAKKNLIDSSESVKNEGVGLEALAYIAGAAALKQLEVELLKIEKENG